jgi:hypothetical protein
MDWTQAPGWELVGPGIEALRRGEETVEALLVSIGAIRLRDGGLELPPTITDDPERRLYELLAKDDQDSAHERYNALIRRLVRFERVCDRVCTERLRADSMGPGNGTTGASAPALGP